MNSDRNIEEMDHSSFRAIAELAYSESGLQLVAEKTSMIQSRLRNRVRAVGLNTFKTYAEFVCSDEGIPERLHMISALTTNVSHFFREKHHFDILSSAILPSVIERVRKGDPFRIWSAGCSNGQEAYSIAMTALEAFPDIASLDFKVLATDIDPEVVRFASKAEYPERLVGGIPKTLLQKHFVHQEQKGEIFFAATSKLKSQVVFKELNLLGKWPMKKRMDVIFCRNVVIYFDGQTQSQLWPRFHSLLDKNGILFLGHSERIAEPGLSGFVNDGPTSYRPKLIGEKTLRGGISYVT